MRGVEGKNDCSLGGGSFMSLSLSSSFSSSFSESVVPSPAVLASGFSESIRSIKFPSIERASGAGWFCGLY